MLLNLTMLYKFVESVKDGDDVESIKINPDLAKLKGFPLKTNDITLKCGYPNIQTLPADEITRSCFIPEEGNVFCSCDWSAKLNYSH